jgi:HAD superfamily hydrolase (TIGR01509 family)
VRDISGAGMLETIDRLHEIKTAAYEQAVQDGEVAMRPGVLALLSAAHEANLQLAIATTTSPVNISALLRQAIGADWRHYFVVIEDASTAPRKKPDPSVYLQTLARLSLQARQCVAFEDSENGLRAATSAGLGTIVTPNSFTAGHNFEGALRVLPDLQGVGLSELRTWHAAQTEALS